MNTEFKSGFAAIIGRPNVGKVHADESLNRTKNCHYVQKAPDNQK